MSGPRNATTTNRGRTYLWRDETFDSVTTILSGGIPKPALTNWAAKSVAEYVAAAVPLAQNQTIEAAQLVVVKGDIAALPNGVVTDIAQAVGRTATMSLPSGAPLRLDLLRSKPVVQQGQTVKVVSTGQGFSVSAEAKAIGNAGAGQVVQVRTPAGAVLSGVARAGGLVEVVF